MKKKTKTKKIERTELNDFEDMLRNAGEPYEWDYDVNNETYIITIGNYGEPGSTSFSFNIDGDLISVAIYQ